MSSPENISHSFDFDFVGLFVCLLFVVLFDLKNGSVKGKEKLFTGVILMHVSDSLVHS